MKKAVFIVLEGIDGAGKTTLAQRLVPLLRNAAVTAEPTAGPVGTALREGTFGNIPAVAEALLFTADRAVHTEEVKKLLGMGCSVICDRYFASTVAYQSAAGAADEAWLEEIQVHSVIEPDITFLLDLDPAAALSRVDARHEEKSRFEELDYLGRVRAAYLKLAKKHGYCVLDAEKTPEEVYAAAVRALKERGLYASE
ncbi:MAG: dTMP kinase [Methanomethylophilus sp.]